MIQFDLHAVQYCVSGQDDFALSHALRCWKAKFETIEQFTSAVIVHPALHELGKYVQRVWDDIHPITVQEAMVELNLEKRRVLFDCIGVSKLFSELQPTLLDRQTLTKVRTRWDEHNEPYQYTFDDTYELYVLDGGKLFPGALHWQRPTSVYAVCCRCTSTGRQYWIYVSADAALGDPRSVNSGPDAIRAIAWTIQLDITKPKRIFRQGDIIIAEESEHSEEVPLYHLSKEDYLSLMYAET